MSTVSQHPLQYTLPSTNVSSSSQNSAKANVSLPPPEPVSKVKFLQRKPPKVFTKSIVEEKLIARAVQRLPSSTTGTSVTTTLPTLPPLPSTTDVTTTSSLDPWSKKEDTKRLTSIVIRDHQRRAAQRSEYLRNLPKLSSVFSTHTLLTNEGGGSGLSYNPEYTIHQQTIAKSTQILQSIEQKKRTKGSKDETKEPLQLDTHDPDDEDYEEEKTKNSSSKKTKDATLSSTHLSTVDTQKLTHSSVPQTIPTKKKKKLTKAEKRRADKALFMSKLANAILETSVSSSSSSVTKKVSTVPTTLISSSLPKEMIDIVSAQQAILGVPLPEDLRGSLRTLKPVTASTLLSTQLLNISTQGLAHPRNPRHATNQIIENENGQDIINVLSSRQLARLKRTGNPWREIEFPRRKEFEPAQEAVKQIMGGGMVGTKKTGRK